MSWPIESLVFLSLCLTAKGPDVIYGYELRRKEQLNRVVHSRLLQMRH